MTSFFFFCCELFCFQIQAWITVACICVPTEHRARTFHCIGSLPQPCEVGNVDNIIIATYRGRHWGVEPGFKHGSDARGCILCFFPKAFHWKGILALFPNDSESAFSPVYSWHFLEAGGKQKKIFAIHYNIFILSIIQSSSDLLLVIKTQINGGVIE